MIDVGRLCVKTAGRDAGHTCVVVDVIDEHTVLIDGDVRRRSCNISHLEPLAEKVDIKKGASHDDVVGSFSTLQLAFWSSKPKKAVQRPRHARKGKGAASTTQGPDDAPKAESGAGEKKIRSSKEPKKE